MTIYVHGISALPMLYESSANLPRSAATSLRGCTARVTKGSREDLLLRRLGAETRPLHLLVDDADKRTYSANAFAHVWTRGYPRESFLKHSNELFISSPELSYLQMAKDLDVIDVIRLGFELCGSYLMGEDFVNGFTEAKPLTKLADITSFLRKAGAQHGSKRALAALRWVKEGSRSPRETALSMMLGLPTRLGGWQLGKHVLNYELDVGVDVEGRMRRYIDLYWPDKGVGLEYDSDTFHVGKERIASDSIREKVIEQQGIRLLRITNSELVDPMKRKLAIEVLADNLGIRLKNKAIDVKRRRDELAYRLLNQKPLF